MKRTGILNTDLSAAISRVGHGDLVLIGDVGCAFPENRSISCIDLAVTKGIPSVTDVLGVVLDELEVESFVVAEEAEAASPQAMRNIESLIAGYKNKGNAIVKNQMPHEHIKDIWLGGKQMKVFVRTGEYTPWGYVLLIGGVGF